jgi:hypothetical protein
MQYLVVTNYMTPDRLLPLGFLPLRHVSKVPFPVGNFESGNRSPTSRRRLDSSGSFALPHGRYPQLAESPAIEKTVHLLGKRRYQYLRPLNNIHPLRYQNYLDIPNSSINSTEVTNAR